jgi:hypothetical protein
MAATDASTKNRTVQVRTVTALIPYLWPKGRGGIKARVVAALISLALAKLANVSVPLFYKDAVDALDTGGGVEDLVAVPIALLVGYGLTRLLGRPLSGGEGGPCSPASRNPRSAPSALQTFQPSPRAQPALPFG